MLPGGGLRHEAYVGGFGSFSGELAVVVSWMLSDATGDLP